MVAGRAGALRLVRLAAETEAAMVLGGYHGADWSLYSGFRSLIIFLLFSARRGKSAVGSSVSIV